MSDGGLSQAEIDAFLGGGISQLSRVDQETEELAAFRDRWWRSQAGARATGVTEEVRREVWLVLETGLKFLVQSQRLGLMTVGDDLRDGRAGQRPEPEFFLEWCHRVVGMDRERGIGPEQLAAIVEEKISASNRELRPLIVVSAIGALALMQGALPEALVRAVRPVLALQADSQPDGSDAGGKGESRSASALFRAPKVVYDYDRIGFWRGELPEPQQSEADPDLWYLLDTNMSFLRFDNRTGRLRDATPLDGSVPANHWQLRRAWNRVGAPSFAYDEQEDRLFLARPSFAHPGMVTAQTPDEDLRDVRWHLEAWEPTSGRLLWSVETPARPQAIEPLGRNRVRVGLDNIGIVEFTEGEVDRRIPVEDCGRVWSEVRRWSGYSLFGLTTGLLFVSLEEDHFVAFPSSSGVDISSMAVLDDVILVSGSERDPLRIAGERVVVHLCGAGLPWEGWTVTKFTPWFLTSFSPNGEWVVASTSDDRTKKGVWFDRRRFFPQGDPDLCTWAVGALTDIETIRADYGPATTTRGMPVLPFPLRDGRLAIAASDSSGAVLYHGRRDTPLSSARGQEYPLEPRHALVDLDAGRIAVYGGVVPGVRILDGEGNTIAESSREVAVIEELFDLDPESESVQIFGRSATVFSVLGENPRQETWRWYWRENRWEATGYPFEGIERPFEGEPRVFFRDSPFPYLAGDDPGHPVQVRARVGTNSIWALAADITRLDIQTREQERFPVHLTAYGLSWEDAEPLFDLPARRCWILGRDGALLAFDLESGELLWHSNVIVDGPDLEGRLSLLRECFPAVGTGSTLAVRSNGCIDVFDAEGGTHLTRLLSDGAIGPVTSVAFGVGERAFAYAGPHLLCWE